MSTLQIRLKNCIQTILDLEPDMRAGIWGRHFDEELSTLKDYLQQRGPYESGGGRRATS